MIDPTENPLVGGSIPPLATIIKAVSPENVRDQGMIFRFPVESVYVYWSTVGLEASASDDYFAAPFSTADYDATTMLRCKAAPDAEMENCPAGILRMGNGQASVVVKSPSGEQ